MHNGYFTLADIMKHFEYQDQEKETLEKEATMTHEDELNIVQTSELITEPKLDAESIEALARELDRVNHYYNDILKNDPFSQIEVKPQKRKNIGLMKEL